MAKNALKLVDSEEVVAMPEYDIKKLISDRNTFMESAKDRDDKIKEFRKKEREGLNIQVNKLKRENEDLNRKIDSLQKIIKAKDDVIQKRDAELKTKNDEIRQTAANVEHYKQEIVSLKRQPNVVQTSQAINDMRQKFVNGIVGR